MDVEEENVPSSDRDIIEICSTAERLHEIDCPQTQATCVISVSLLLGNNVHVLPFSFFELRK